MRFMHPELGEAEMSELAAGLAERGWQGGIPALAQEARNWIAGRQWADLAAEDVPDLTDARALSGVARMFPGGLTGFVAAAVPPAGRC
jgi:hypothetical protein